MKDLQDRLALNISISNLNKSIFKADSYIYDVFYCDNLLAVKY